MTVLSHPVTGVITKTNPIALVEGVSISPVVLHIDKRYMFATVVAMKPGAGSHNTPADNTGKVYLLTSTSDISGALMLCPGNKAGNAPAGCVVLPPGGNLNLWYLAVEVADDGVVIYYHW